MTGVPFDAGARFIINGKLGSGSFGVVYDAVDRYRNRPVALKVLERAAPETVMRFKREFRYLAELRHPNLASMYEMLVLDEKWVLSMELVRGSELLEYLAFTELQKDTASQAQDSADDVLRLQGVQLSTPATKEFRDLSVQANNVLVDLNNALDNDGTRAASLEKLRLIVAQIEADGDFADLLTREGVSATSEDGKKIVEALVKIRSDARALERNDLLNKINQAILDKGK